MASVRSNIKYAISTLFLLRNQFVTCNKIKWKFHLLLTNDAWNADVEFSPIKFLKSFFQNFVGDKFLLGLICLVFWCINFLQQVNTAKWDFEHSWCGGSRFFLSRGLTSTRIMNRLMWKLMFNRDWRHHWRRIHRDWSSYWNGVTVAVTLSDHARTFLHLLGILFKKIKHKSLGSK